MTEDQVLDEFRAADALWEGHFVLASGLHSPVYLQKMRIFRDPVRTARVCGALAQAATQRFGKIDLIVSPAVGGIIPGYETARAIGCNAIFVERGASGFELKRGFEIPRGARLVMVEDIVTTGVSSRECLAELARHDGEILGAACIIDRSGGKADIGVPLVSLCQLDIPAYPADALPPQLAAIPPVKPGTRAQQAA